MENQTQKNWGLENTKIIPDPSSKFDNILRVYYPAGSASPRVLNRGGLTFRKVNRLTIDGILFSTFFGGGDPS